MRMILGGIGLAITLLIVSAFFGSWYTIDQGYRGVLLRNGAFVNTVEPGLGFKLPFFDTVREISIRDGSRSYPDMLTYSKDQQTAAINLSVNYRIPVDAVDEVYMQYGSEDALLTRLVDRKVYEQTKNVFGQFNAATAVQERTRLNAEIQQAIMDSVQGPVQILSVQIENIDFSDAYENAIEARMTAEVEVQKVRQNADKAKIDAQITVTQAQAQADSRLAQAKAEAEAIRIRGEAEADAIRAKSEALKASPNLIQLTQAEKWDGKLPTQMVPNGTVPFLDLTPVTQVTQP